MADSDRHMDERAVTEAGNPGNPQGAYGEKMLERMNRSHADVTTWALDQLAYKAQERALDIGCGGGATMERLARRIAAAGGAGHLTLPMAKARGFSLQRDAPNGLYEPVPALVFP